MTSLPRAASSRDSSHANVSKPPYAGGMPRLPRMASLTADRCYSLAMVTRRAGTAPVLAGHRAEGLQMVGDLHPGRTPDSTHIPDQEPGDDRAACPVDDPRVCEAPERTTGARPGDRCGRSQTSSVGVDERAEQSTPCRRESRGRELVCGTPAAFLTELARCGPVGKQANHRVRKRRRVIVGHQETGAAVLDHLRNPPEVTAHYGAALRHRLDDDVRDGSGRVDGTATTHESRMELRASATLPSQVSQARVGSATSISVTTA